MKKQIILYSMAALTLTACSRKLQLSDSQMATISPYDKIPLDELQLKGHISWRGEHPILPARSRSIS